MFNQKWIAPSLLFAVALSLTTLARGQSPANEKVKILEAVYGDLPDGNKENVTEKISLLLKNGKLNIEVTNELLGDPAEQVSKKLRIKYELGGKTMEATVNEGETMLLPQPKLVGELKILSAKYGETPDGSTFDVKDQVVSQLKGNRLEITVDNDTFGDPASGVFKRLRVEYQIGDVKLFKSVYEGGKMIIEVPTSDDDAKKETSPKPDAPLPLK